MRTYLWIGFAEVVVVLLVGVLGFIVARATRQLLSYRGQPLFEKRLETSGFKLGLVFAAGTLVFADVMIVLLSYAPRAFVKLMEVLGLHLTQLVIGAAVVMLGYLAYKSEMFPTALGITLIVGGACYLVGMVAIVLALDFGEQLNVIVTLPSAIAELWMVGYLLIKGVRSGPQTEVTNRSQVPIVSVPATA